MTRISLKTVVFAAPLVAAAAGACSSSPSETFGGTGGTSNAGTTATGAGTASTSGGTSSTSAGTASTDAGTASTTAGTAATTGGTNSTAGTATTGGASGSGTGGTSGSGTGGGSAGTGGGGACETLDCIAGGKNTNMDALTNAFIMFGCYQKASQDCITIPAGMQCPNQDGNLPFEQQGISQKQTFKLGGVAGTKYLLSVTVNGISEAKYYEKGTRAAGNTDPANPDAVAGTDTFYTGGDPVNFENYNVYKIVSQDAAGMEIQHYYLNSFPQTNTPYEHHQTFPIAFTHDIEVAGGGTVILFASDRNCHAIDNCGIGFRTTSCADAEGRSVPNEPNLTLPTTYMGAPVSQINLFGGNMQPFHSQVIHIVAKSVKPM